MNRRVVMGPQASMEPPCEHGGVTLRARSAQLFETLQWSRRVNTAEWHGCFCRSSGRESFNGAAV